jgi:hypothetical protein
MHRQRVPACAGVARPRITACMEIMRRTGAALTFFVSGLVFVAGCGVFDPGPQFGALTGNWAGWCCPGLFDAGGQWYLALEEDSSGDVTGTVEYIQAGGPAMQPRIVSGTVAGDTAARVFRWASATMTGVEAVSRESRVPKRRFGAIWLAGRVSDRMPCSSSGFRRGLIPRGSGLGPGVSGGRKFVGRLEHRLKILPTRRGSSSTRSATSRSPAPAPPSSSNSSTGATRRSHNPRLHPEFRGVG